MSIRTLENIPVADPLEDALEVYGSVYSICELRAPFLETKYATMLAAMNPRFDGFLWDDAEKFREKLGPDVDPVQHGPYQARSIGIPMLRMQEANPDLPQLPFDLGHHFIAHHVQHDDHEGLEALLRNSRSDRKPDEKTKISEEQERSLRSGMQRQIFGELAADEYLARIELFDDESSFYGQFWNVSEKIGYLATAIRAVELAEGDEDLTSAERVAMFMLAKDVLKSSYSEVEESANQIAFADHALLNLGHTLASTTRFLGVNNKELLLL